MTNVEKIRALDWEARRRGTSYGKLEAQLLPGEAEEIYERYIKYQRGELVEAEDDRGKPKGEPEKKRKARPRCFDTDAAMRLYKEGLNDRQIADRLKTRPQYIWVWRDNLGLPARAERGRPKAAASE